MRKIALLLIALCFSPELMACVLVGTWQSDAAATMSFNRANAKLEERQDRFLASLMGKMTLEFTDKQLHWRMPDTQVIVKGKVKPFAGFEERNPYKILFCNSRMAKSRLSPSIQRVSGSQQAGGTGRSLSSKFPRRKYSIRRCAQASPILTWPESEYMLKHRFSICGEIAMRIVSIFKNGSNRAIRIPKDLDFEGF